MYGPHARHAAAMAVFLLATAVVFIACSKDDTPVNPGGPTGIQTINFSDASPSVTVASGAAATSVKLAGGTLPYAVAGAPNGSVATVSISSDTVTITPVAPGSTSVTISDASPLQSDAAAPRSVTISIVISGGGSPSGSGIMEYTLAGSHSGNVSYSGTGLWPPSGTGVAAALGNSGKKLEVVGYHQTASVASGKSAALRFNYAAFILESATPFTAGQVVTSADVSFGFDLDPVAQSALQYNGVDGSLTIDSISGSRVAMHFSGRVAHGTDTLVVTAGTVHATYIVGELAGLGGGGVGVGGSGSVSFNSDRGNFSASGTYNITSSTGQGAGGIEYSSSGFNYLTVYGYIVASPTDISVTSLTFINEGEGLTAGDYPFTFSGTNFAVWGYSPHVNPNDSSTYENSFVLTSGTSHLGTYTATQAAGTFSGAGLNYQTTATINVSSGAFDISNFGGTIAGGTQRAAVERIVERMVRKRFQ